MTARARRTRLDAAKTPGWLDRQLRRQRIVTAASLFSALFLVPAIIAFVLDFFHELARPTVVSLNTALWNSNTMLMLLAADTLVATVLIPTVIATRRDTAFGDRLSEFLEMVGSIASTTVALSAIGLAWTRILLLFHEPGASVAARVTHIAEIAMTLLVAALACSLFAANRVDISSLRESLNRDRAEFERLSAIDGQLMACNRATVRGCSAGSHSCGGRAPSPCRSSSPGTT